MDTTKRKVFAYVVRFDRPTLHLLVFESHDEDGFEVPKGGVESGEAVDRAAVREVFEESGIPGVRAVRTLGSRRYRDELQRGVILRAPDGLAETFVHTVTGSGIDRGLRYAYRWLPIDASLERRLVQGCGEFVPALIEAVGRMTET